MNADSRLLWIARILGIGVCVFLSLFALDALEPGKPISARVGAFVIHLMPAALVLGVVILSWRRPWLGGFAFVALAAAYALIVRSRPDWVLVISGPLLTVGILFLWSWYTNHRDGRRLTTR